MYNIPVGSIGNPVTAPPDDNYLEFNGIYLPITIENYVTEADEILNAIQAVTFDLPEILTPQDNELIYTAYEIDSFPNYSYITIPMINYDSDEVREFNSKIRDEIMYDFMENIETLPEKKYVARYTASAFFDCIAVSLYKNSDVPTDYYYNLKENTYITFEDYLWHGIIQQLNSDAFYENYFKDYIDRDYIITREKNQIEIFGAESPYFKNMSNSISDIQITLTLNNTTLDVFTTRRFSQLNSDLFLIVTDYSIDLEKYAVSENTDNVPIIATKYSAEFNTGYAVSYGRGYFTNIFNIPQITSTKPNAVRINQEIIDFMFRGSIKTDFKLIEMELGDFVNGFIRNLHYAYFINDNILGIILRNSTGLLIPPAADLSFKFIYYDYINDRELSLDEYMNYIGYTYDDITEIINDPMTNEYYSGYGYTYSQDRVFTESDIKGVFLRNDGAFEILTTSDYNYGNDFASIYIITPYKSETGMKLIAYKEGFYPPAPLNRTNSMYTYLAVLTDDTNSGYQISSNADTPYQIYYISDTEIAALGITDTTIELGAPQYRTVKIEISDILRHHSADPEMKYENVSAEIESVTDGEIVIQYQIESITGKIYIDLTANEPIINYDSDEPFNYEKYIVEGYGDTADIIATKYSASFKTIYHPIDYGEYTNKFDIPQLISDKPAALKINQNIIEFLFDEQSQKKFKLIEQGLTDYLDNLVYEKNYTYLINDNILGIVLQDYVGLAGSEGGAVFKFIYYDNINDRELNSDEYLNHIGYTYSDITAILNEEYPQEDIKYVFLRDDGVFEIVVDTHYNDIQFSWIKAIYDIQSKTLKYQPIIDRSK